MAHAAGVKQLVITASIMSLAAPDDFWTEMTISEKSELGHLSTRKRFLTSDFLRFLSADSGRYEPSDGRRRAPTRCDRHRRLRHLEGSR